MPGRAHEGEGGLSRQGQLGGADGTACGKSGGIVQASILHLLDVLMVMHSGDILQTGRKVSTNLYSSSTLSGKAILSGDSTGFAGYLSSNALQYTIFTIQDLTSFHLIHAIRNNRYPTSQEQAGQNQFKSKEFHFKIDPCRNPSAFAIHLVTGRREISSILRFSLFGSLI
jgi:hypothetical protein